MARDRRFYLECLHKREAGPIFDPLRWEYVRAGRVSDWDFDGSRLRLRVETEPRRWELAIELLPLGRRAVMVRAGIEGLPELEVEPLMVKDRLEPVDARVEEGDGEVRLSTGEVVCRVRLSEWHLEVADRSGRAFFREYAEGLLRSAFPVIPMCCKLVDGEVHFVESAALSPTEAIYGLGERFGRLNKRGQRLLLWNCDATMTSSDRSYKSIPLYLSSRGYGLFVKSSAKMVFEVGSDYCYNAVSFEVWQDRLEYVVLYGPSLKDVLSMYAELTGKPPLPPLWSFGLWMSRCSYRNRREVEEVARRLRAHGVPCDVIHIDPEWLRPGHYCDLEWNAESFPDPEGMLDELRRMGFKVCLWIQPYVPRGTAMYEEGAREGYFARREDGSVYHIVDFTRREVGIVDFTNPRAREWYKERLKRLHRMGVAVFKCDMGEAVPEDAVFHDGKRGIEVHNLYPLLYQGTVFEASREALGEGLVWGRSGCAGIQRYPVQWSGDSHSTFEDMACVLWGGLSYSMSGVPFWSHDIGGFHGRPSPKLYVRWSQWGLLCSHSRCHGTTPREPWEYGDEALRVFREFARLRYSLLPYLYSCAYEASRTGLPVVRPLVLEFQDDPAVRELDTEYMLGPYLLVVPVLSEDDVVEYYLPGGMWLDWWARRTVEGGSWRREVVPLDRIPLFVRENALIPRVEPTNYVGERPYGEVRLEVFLRDRASVRYLFDDEEFELGATREEDVVTVTLGPSRKRWVIELYDEDEPRDVSCKGCRLESWSYDGGLRRVSVAVRDVREGATVRVIF